MGIFKAKSRIKRLFFYAKSWYLMLVSNPIVIHGFFGYKGFKFINGNFGDDINIPLIEHLSGRKVLLKDHVFRGNYMENLLAIGSLIDYYTNQHSVIWGSGVIEGINPLIQQPQKVHAVRGRLSYEYLTKQGIKCPEVFGDPALLMPLIYRPNIRKIYKIGIIPHVKDYDLPHVKEFRDKHPEILFIKFGGYSKWQDVIDQINSCECIISSSLHGLIVSDSYGVPNVWVTFSNNIVGGEYKFKDYFTGVNRTYLQPIDFKNRIDIGDIRTNLKLYKPIDFNPIPLLKAFPYDLSPKFKAIIKSKIT